MELYHYMCLLLNLDHVIVIRYSQHFLKVKFLVFNPIRQLSQINMHIKSNRNFERLIV